MLMPFERMRVGISSERRQPDAHARPDGIKRREDVDAAGGQPAVPRRGHGSDQRVLDLQRRRLRRFEIGQRIGEHRGYLFSGTQFSRFTSISGFLSSERTAVVAATKSPYE